MTRHVPIGIKTSPQNVDWPTLDAVWTCIGEHEVFGSVRMNDRSARASKRSSAARPT